ncbi:MAG: PQQ-binding-like beta-propeller repeat protein [Myxococcota bacterium]
MPVRRTALALRPFRPVRGPGSVAILLALALASAACERSQRGDGAIEAAHPEDAARAASAPRPVDAARLADPAPGEWPSHGRSYLEQRYSPLSQIDTTNVGRLGLAWSFDLGSDRGVEATPLVADGTLYVTGPWSVLHAIDAATGEPRWTYDPQVPRGYARSICCGVVNRGPALFGDRVFVGTLDGRLVAVDRETGREALVDLDRRARLELLDHGRAARRRQPRRDRQRGRRSRRARPRVGLRRGDGRARLAHLHGPRRPGEGLPSRRRSSAPPAPGPA